jgi:hypothetical protein
MGEKKKNLTKQGKREKIKRHKQIDVMVLGI